MAAPKTIFAVIPAAQAVKSALAGFQALPSAENAKLVGVHVAPAAMTYGLVSDIALASFIEAQIEAAKAERDAAKASFSAACQQAGIPFEWRVAQTIDTLVSPQAGSMARAAGLVLCPTLPQQASLGRHRLEEVVFASGRPVIGLPADWNGPRLGGRVLIAWDGGREAARAIFDAMPLLLQADEVRLFSVNGFQWEPVRQFTPADEMATTLSRHRVRWRHTAMRAPAGALPRNSRLKRLSSVPISSSWAVMATPAFASVSWEVCRERCSAKCGSRLLLAS